MALKLNSENIAQGDASAARKSNRRETIRTVGAEIAGLKAQRKAINEQISELVNQVVKGDLGWTIKDFDRAYSLAKLEDDKKDKAFDVLREVFDALGVGDQLSWLDAVDKAGGHTPQPTAGPIDEDGFDTGAKQGVAEAESYNAGYKAAQDGLGLDACMIPAAHKSLLAKWQTGWSDGKADKTATNVTPIKRGRGRPPKGAQPVTAAEREAARPTAEEMAQIQNARGPGEMIVTAETLGPDIEEDFLPSELPEETAPIDGAGIRERMLDELPTEAADDTEY